MWNKYEDKLIHQGMRWFSPGFRVGREKWFKKTQEWYSAQPYFIVASVGPGLLLYGPNNFTLALIYHSIIWGKISNKNKLKCVSATKLQIWLLWSSSNDFIHPILADLENAQDKNLRRIIACNITQKSLTL